jgi:hypothetical protein
MGISPYDSSFIDAPERLVAGMFLCEAEDSGRKFNNAIFAATDLSMSHKPSLPR